MNPDEGTLNDAEVDEAKRLWAEYQDAHDLSGRVGDVVGIDPESGGVWIGRRFADVAAARNADGVGSLLWFERVGSPTALTKGGRT